MDHRIDLERLSQVFTDHSWLAEAISNGAWWSTSQGGIRVVAPVEDPLELRAGLLALADALGCEQADVGVAGPTSALVPAPQLATRSRVVRARRIGRQ